MAKKGTALARAAALRYWGEDDARVVIEAWQRSGLALVSFAERHGLQPKRLRWWTKRLGPVRTEPVDFHPVQLVEARHRNAPAGDRIEVVLGDGCTVCVPRGFSSEDLRRVLEVLEGRAGC